MPNPAPAVTELGGWVVTTHWGAAALTLRGLVGAAERPLPGALQGYPAPTRLSGKSLKVVAPAEAVLVSVPPGLAPPGLAPSATVTLLLKLVAVFPKVSWAVTVSPKAAPAVTVAGGWVEMTHWVAGAGVIETLPVVAVVR